jgi:hypothetical protein
MALRHQPRVELLEARCEDLLALSLSLGVVEIAPLPLGLRDHLKERERVVGARGVGAARVEEVSAAVGVAERDEQADATPAHLAA